MEEKKKMLLEFLEVLALLKEIFHLNLNWSDLNVTLSRRSTLSRKMLILRPKIDLEPKIIDLKPKMLTLRPKNFGLKVTY